MWCFYDTDDDLHGLALASGAMCAAIGPAVEDLATRTRQHLVRFTGLAAGKKRYRISDPAQDPPRALEPPKNATSRPQRVHVVPNAARFLGISRHNTRRI